MKKFILFFVLSIFNFLANSNALTPTYYSPDYECPVRCSFKSQDLNCETNIEKIKEIKTQIDAKINLNMLSTVEKHEQEKEELLQLTKMVDLGYQSFLKSNSDFCSTCCSANKEKGVCLFSWDSDFNKCFYNYLSLKDNIEETLSYLKSVTDYEDWVKKYLEGEKIVIPAPSSVNSLEKSKTLDENLKKFIDGLRPSFGEKRMKNRYRLRKIFSRKH